MAKFEHEEVHIERNKDQRNRDDSKVASQRDEDNDQSSELSEIDDEQLENLKSEG